MSEGPARLARRIGEYQVAAIVLGAAATLLISVLPTLSFGYENPDLHVMLETTASLVSGLAAFLIYGRYRRTGLLSELVLSIALTMLTVANVAAALTPSASDMLDEQAVWVPLWTRMVAAAALAAAAFTARREVRRPGLAPWALLGGAATVGAAALAASVVGPHLGTGIDPGISPASSDHPRVVGSAGELACQLTTMALAVAASVGFSLRARQTDDELLGWFALAATLAAFSRLNYVLFPSGYSDWVFTGDFFRLGANLLILVGAGKQISAYQRQAAEAAVLAERRRIARDLHDGLAQDLAFISMQASRLMNEEQADSIAVAADRALADSRGAISALSSPPDEPLADSVTRMANLLGRRSDAEIKVHVETEVEASHERREALLRILSEAISNAIRHGGASMIIVRLSGGRGLRLAVADNGNGFDPDVARASGGFGLATMRDRAEQLGGSLVLRARPGQGTEVEVLLP
jgi:signal transduction histidine kinase